MIAESYATPKPVTIGLLLLAQIHKHINGELTMTYRLNIQDISVCLQCSPRSPSWICGEDGKRREEEGTFKRSPVSCGDGIA